MTNRFTKTALIICISGASIGCNSPSSSTTLKPQQKPADERSYRGVHGTWTQYSKYGFTLIEITDSTHVTYYQVADQRELNDTISHNRYWYYKSAAKMGYWGKDSTNIWIRTDRFRFDYRVERDGSFREYDKMGDQGLFVKMPTSRN